MMMSNPRVAANFISSCLKMWCEAELEPPPSHNMQMAVASGYSHCR